MSVAKMSCHRSEHLNRCSPSPMPAGHGRGHGYGRRGGRAATRAALNIEEEPILKEPGIA